jgi:hypothetical protein
VASGGAFYTSQQEIGFYCTRFTVYELFAQIFFRLSSEGGGGGDDQ